MGIEVYRFLCAHMCTSERANKRVHATRRGWHLHSKHAVYFVHMGLRVSEHVEQCRLGQYGWKSTLVIKGDRGNTLPIERPSDHAAGGKKKRNEASERKEPLPEQMRTVSVCTNVAFLP